MTKLVIISDTHNYHNEINLPMGDILIHCGDATIGGSQSERKKFARWWHSLPYKHKIFVAGNHGISWETHKYYADQDVENMHGKGVIINGLKFYGLSWSVRYGDWAFMLPERLLANEWNNIPKDVDVLITHGPPYGIMDFNYAHNSCGSESLRQIVLQIKPKIHCFGHIHESYGQIELNGIKFINAAICNGGYDPVNLPIVIEI